MSKALDYLLEARPEAMGAYFKFLKEAETHLDTKTRDLISVITKVAVKTDGGFRHYLKRALQNGASANEVLDALLMAFPVLGLAKIVWATDILLEMDLEEFRPENLGQQQGWHEVAALKDLSSGEATRLEVDGRSLFVHRLDDEIRVYDGRCPHQGTEIPAESLDGETLTCPRHSWSFDLESGECTAVGNRPLNRLQSKVVDGRLHVQW